MHQDPTHQKAQPTGLSMEQDGGGTTLAAPILNLQAGRGFGSGERGGSSAPVQLQKTSSPASKMKDKDPLKQIRTWLSWWDVPEEKVLAALKHLSSSQRKEVLAQAKTYLDPMAKAFTPHEMATALKSLGETDAHRALQYIFKSKSWFNFKPNGDDFYYFFTRGSSASLLKVQQDKALLKKIENIWRYAILDRPGLDYLPLINARYHLNPQIMREEIAGGIPSKEKIGGTTLGFVNLRSQPSAIASTYMGKLNGDGHSVVLTDKKIKDGHTWYKATFKDVAAFTKLFNPKAPQNKDVQAAKAKHYAWISAKGLDLHVSYSQFRRQLKSWEKAHPKLTVKQRITRLREMSHSSNLPFGKIIGKKQGKHFHDSRPDFSDLHQILQQAQGVMMPDGKKVDMYHFIVGLDVLEKSNPRISHKGIGPYCVGENYSAATWAGDIGAGVADMVLMKGSKSNGYEKNFRATKSAKQKKNLSYNITEARRQHYFKMRAPEADLLADIDAWAGAPQVGEAGMNSVSAVVEKYYGGASDQTGKTLHKNRRKAIENFIRNYNFRKVDGLISQSDPFKRMQHQVYQFAKIWCVNKSWNPIKGQLNQNLLYAEAGEMTKIFLNWVERLAKTHNVKI